jgi:hypothetical protein
MHVLSKIALSLAH